MSVSKTLFVLTLCFILGVSLPSIMLGFLLMFAIYLLYRSPLLSVFCLAVFLLGSFHFLNTNSFSPLPPEESVQGVVSKYSQTKEDTTETIVDIGEYKVMLVSSRHTEYSYGDKLLINGNFIKPSGFYASYLKKDGIYYISYYPEVEFLGESSSFKRNLYNIRKSFKERINQVIPTPQAFILEAVMLGDRTSFSSELNNKLSSAGVRHITAVSGMHIVILSSVIFSLLLYFFSWRASCLFTVIFVIVFVIFVGAPSSAIRAGIMGVIMLAGRFFHLSSFSLRSVTLAGAGMLLFNPLLIHYDLGFQLSFLSVIGIIFLFPVFKRKLYSVPFDFKKGRFLFIYKKFVLFMRKREQICDMVCVTLSAVTFTYPLILYNFGSIPIFSVFTNLLILPLLPFVFIFGFISVIFGLSLVAIPCYLLLSFILLVVNVTNMIPFASVSFSVTPLIIIAFYALISYPFMVKYLKS